MGLVPCANSFRHAPFPNAYSVRKRAFQVEVPWGVLFLFRRQEGTYLGTQGTYHLKLLFFNSFSKHPILSLLKDDQIVRDNRYPVHCRQLAVAATSPCDPGRHANAITPCLLRPCLNVPNFWNWRTVTATILILPLHVLELGYHLANQMAYSQNRCGPAISEYVMPWG